MEYNIIEEKGKEICVIKNKTTFRIVKDLLETDYLGSLITEAIEEKGTLNPNLLKGALVSDRRALKAKLVREKLISDIVLNRFLEQEIPIEHYLLLQQYIGSLVLKTEGADNIELKINRGVNLEYFRQKGIKLANYSEGAKWHLESVVDVIYGKCSLGHEIRYAFTAVNNFGDRLVFGSTCVHDFFDINEQLHGQLLNYVEEIKNVTDEYYNDYHAYYEIHEKLDKFLYVMMTFINKVTGDKVFNKSEMGYVGSFTNWSMPIPRPLARQIGLKIHVFLNREFNSLIYGDKYNVVRHFVYMLHCFAQGSHGYTYKDLIGFFPTNFLGDRIMPKEAEQLESLIRTSFESNLNSSFVNEMAVELNIQQFSNILVNLYQLRQISKKLEEDKDFTIKRTRTLGVSEVRYKSLHIDLLQDIDAVNSLFNLPISEDVGKVYNSLKNERWTLTINKDALVTKDTGFIGLVTQLDDSINLKELNKKARILIDFIDSNRNRFKAPHIVKKILTSNYVQAGNEESVEWFNRVVKENGVLVDFKEYLHERTVGLQERIENSKELIKKANENINKVMDANKGYGLRVLENFVSTGRILPRDEKYAKDLEDFLRNIKEESSTETEYQKWLRLAEENPDLVMKDKLSFQLDVLRTVASTNRATEKQLVHVNKIKNMLDKYSLLEE